MPRIDGAETLALPVADVWRLLNDPDVLGRSIPGCGGFEAAGDGSYRASITVAVGAVKGTYDGTVVYRDVEDGRRCTISVDASGDKGGIAGDGRLELSAAGDATAVAYEGSFKLSGPVAGMGQRLAPGISRKMIVETLRNVERHGLDAGPVADAAGGEDELADASPAPVPCLPQPPPEPFRPFEPKPWHLLTAGAIAGALILIVKRRLTGR